LNEGWREAPEALPQPFAFSARGSRREIELKRPKGELPAGG
jgi:hypothetical protein